MNNQKPILIVLILFLAACGAPGGESIVVEEATAVSTPTSSQTAVATYPTPFSTSKYDNLEIVTLLPKDAIPAIHDPQFLDAAAADQKYDPDELIIGVTFNGDARAYSVPFLSNHEIVNDTVGGVKIAVTW